MQTAANKIRLTWVGLFWLLAGLLGACSSRSGTTTVPPTAVFFAPPTLTPDSPAARPDPKRTATVFPAEREITFERPLEAIYLPGEVHELYRFYSDQPRRIGITLEPLDDENDLRLQVLVYDTHQQSLTRAAGPEADPLLRGVWEVPAPGWY
ncbi:MAG: hypothetical protein HY866_06165, partial [Chloroflexi bacterium]|nr:hypothetical protein [Chloroflexota bacterium]